MKTLTFCLVLLAALPCAAGNKKISRDLNVTSGDPNAQTTVMVQFGSDMSDQDSADVAKKGGSLKVKLGSVAAFSLPVSSILDVATLPNVTYVSPDRPVHGQLNYTTAAVNAGIAWKYGWSGAGIAIVDSGISPSADLLGGKKGSSSVVYSEAFGGLAGTVDLYGHGTHVAGIAAGDGSASHGSLSGIAPGANLINLRVLDADGAGSDSAVIAAIARAIDLQKKYNIRVLNLS